MILRARYRGTPKSQHLMTRWQIQEIGIRIQDIDDFFTVCQLLVGAVLMAVLAQ
jgi:hypothetical protein